MVLAGFGSGSSINKQLNNPGIIMLFSIAFGSSEICLDVFPEKLALALPAEFSADCGFATPDLALDNPDDYPRLDQCVTPDDRVVVAVDRIGDNSISEAIGAVLSRLFFAGLNISQVVLLFGNQFSEGAEQAVKGKFPDLKVKRNDPTIVEDSCYLATLRNGKRIYLNRALLESDFQIFIGSPSRGIDGSLVGPEVGILGGLVASKTGDQPLDSEELEEAATLLGVPYLLTVVGALDSTSALARKRWWSGAWQSVRSAMAAHRGIWRARATALADVVLVATSDSEAGGFKQWCQVMRKASKLVTERGQIILVAGDSQPNLLRWETIFERAGEPGEVLENIRTLPKELRCIGWWARAAEKARIQVVSKLSSETVSGMFAHELNVDQIAGLVKGASKVALIGDFSKAIVGSPIVVD